MTRFRLLCLVVMASSSVGAAQTTWYVDVQGTPPGTGALGNPYTSIQYAITRATTQNGDTIRLAPGLYDEAIDFNDKDLWIESTMGPGVTRLGRHANVLDDVPGLSGFTILGGATVYSATLRNCVVLPNPATPYSEGLFVTDRAHIEHCVVSGFNIPLQVFAFSTDQVVIENTVFWNCAQGPESHSGGTMRYCAGLTNPVSPLAGWNLSNNLSGDPLLWDLANGDARPRPGSPCIDSGNPATPNDPDGSRADIGAFPYDPAYAPSPTTYCVGKLNSQGCVPAIAWSGNASASDPTPFLITATNIVPHRRGFVFYGFAPDSVPWQGATYCVLQPTRRTKGQDSLGGPAPCTGTYSFDFNERIQLGLDPLLLPGQMVYGQYWLRDPADPTGYQSGVSNAISFGIAP